ncbi:MAG: phosphopentomutase [Rhodothermaceae bacterium]|nr:phosphopentomutase [Rhodothermaceae bacterium]
MGNFYLIIIDGLGVGAQEDAADYGDAGSNTLGHVSEATGVKLPNFARLGLGNIIPLPSVPPAANPEAAFGKMRERSSGKDSTTGHWELAGIQLEKAFPTYPNGFPDQVTDAFSKHIGRGILANRAASGTQVIEEFGDEHVKTGKPIVYTSADSVFQVACHVDVVPIEQLYEWCTTAREKVMTGPHGVGRVIARPFAGKTGSYYRLSDQRHDFSYIPPEPNLLTVLQAAGIKTYSVGKVIDLFAERGFTQFRRTKSNDEGIAQLLSVMAAVQNSFIFVNLIDTDQLYGHRNDVAGYALCLENIDRALPALLGKMEPGDVMLFTGDHGNDPAAPGTDHTREFVPLLVYPADACNSVDLGTRRTFADVADSVTDFFNIEGTFGGKSFIK